MKNLLLLIVLLAAAQVANANTREFASSQTEVRPLLEGMSVPNTVIQTTDNEPVSLKALIMEKPTLLIFYRGGWCPYCNRQLSELKDIEDDLTQLGYQVIAISPQSFEELKRQELKQEQAAKLFIDEKLQTIREFGIGFVVDNATEEKYQGYGINLHKNDDGRPVLPAPALFFVDQQGMIQFSYVNPDYKVRPSARLVLSVAKALANDK